MSVLLLVYPKFVVNVASALRAAACWGAQALWWTGDRVQLDDGPVQRVKTSQRLPRELRLAEYREAVPVCTWDSAEDAIRYAQAQGWHPVAVEYREPAERLQNFVHPEQALYVFGPEDGGLSRFVRASCYRQVVIPTAHCLNLAAAVNVVLYDRGVKKGSHLAALPRAGGVAR